MSPEATALRSALNTVLKEVQVFERELFVPPILVAIQATAQNVLYVESAKEGYDWRDIHMVVAGNGNGGRGGVGVTLDPRPLTERANLLLQEIFEEIANEQNSRVSRRDPAEG